MLYSFNQIFETAYLLDSSEWIMYKKKIIPRKKITANLKNSTPTTKQP